MRAVALLDWWSPALAWSLFGLSLLTFLASLVVVPWLVVRIPADYFLDPDHPPRRGPSRHPALRFMYRSARNVAGLLMVGVGFLLLFMPGQGVLTIFAGLTLMRFPGKYRLERRVMSQNAVLKAVNWLRRRSGHADLLLDGWTPETPVSGQSVSRADTRHPLDFTTLRDDENTTCNEATGGKDA